jgi:hypothetical protein
MKLNIGKLNNKIEHINRIKKKTMLSVVMV